MKHLSVTKMNHVLLDSLSDAPFDDLAATDFSGNIELYSFDSFRRLYNDAVESMLSYRLAESLEEKAIHYEALYEDAMHQLHDM